MASNSFKHLAIHLTIILILSAGIILGFFYVYLPNATNHGQMVDVPSLEGMNLNDIEDMLDKKNLRFQVSDCTFVKDKKPLSILSQYPRAGTQVKENRRIYISVAAQSPPKVKMPNLIDASLKNAQLVCQSYDLNLKNIKYAPHFAKNAILKQFWGTHEIKPGTLLPKGSEINVLVGDGLSSSKVPMPNLVGISYSEAGGILEVLELSLGSTVYDPTSTEDEGTIIKQKPTFVREDSIQRGQMIDVWVSGQDPKSEPMAEEEPAD